MTDRRPVADMSDEELFGEWEGSILAVAMLAQISAPGPTADDDSRIEQIEREMERRGILP
jgi:hypothetical protein